MDLVVRNGTLVDGTGAPPRRVDVGVSAGRVVALGDLSAVEAQHVEDAAGLLITPGFVDLHTHYDGQATWDADLAPSVFHGVTTVITGSCGVGFAPVRVADRSKLIALMEGVEDIPGAALAEGIRWNWESFAQYLDFLDQTPHTLELGCLVPHDALRVYVMGQRGIDQEPAMEADIREMGLVLREALEAGAMGFSTGRTDNHRSATGARTPANAAAVDELIGLAGAFSGLGRGVMQAVSDFRMTEGGEHFDGAFDVIEAMARAAPDRPTSLSLMQRDGAPEQWRRILRRCEAAVAGGLNLRVQVAPRGIGVILGLSCTFHPFIGKRSYQAVAHLPVAERAGRMADPELRRAILSEPSQRVAGDGSAIPPLVDTLLASFDRIAFRMFRLEEEPNYEPTLAASLGAQARATGRSAAEVVYDVLCEGQGAQLIYFPIFNYGSNNLDLVREMLEHPLALAGLSDGGAHAGTICDASFSTFYLSYWARDRRTDRWPIERAVRFLSGEPAAHLGLRDRGTLEVGKRADFNLIDHAALRILPPEVVDDLPAGGRRLLQGAEGYRATFVAGQAVQRDGQLTGIRPGRVVRSGR